MSTELKKKRQLLGFSQIEVAVLTGLSPSTVNRLERGVKPNQSTAEKIAAVLNCRVDEIFNGKLREY
jgi:transcriptional regulator with XRE-family HTH domain